MRLFEVVWCVSILKNRILTEMEPKQETYRELTEVYVHHHTNHTYRMHLEYTCPCYILGYFGRFCWSDWSVDSYGVTQPSPRRVRRGACAQWDQRFSASGMVDPRVSPTHSGWSKNGCITHMRTMVLVYLPNFTYIWLILLGQMLVNIPAPWSKWVICSPQKMKRSRPG